ncbi:MAG: hypothetical protein A2Y25_00100 [Candidatus Melainabacteria bacterium GWF2_37_15]|nr:MAG: hypothetical protein A2Y25_00100 [Candidatus Melainabacteria bacterium GWF2_37_15]
MKKYASEYNLIVAGGGLAGVSAAIAAAREGCKVLIIERYSFLGGCATASLVTPMMKNNDSAGNPLNTGLYTEILQKMAQTKNAATHPDGNPGWFNPEKMKFVLDDLCAEAGVDILFDTFVVGAEKNNDKIISINCVNKAGFEKYHASFFIDATGDADLAASAGVAFEADKHQAMSLRFIMDNVNLYKFSHWLTDIEPEMAMSSVEYVDYETVLLTTAHTSEDIGWKLRPYITLAIRDGVIKPEDAEYFQVFTLPGQKNAVAFNCPRIYSPTPLNPLDPWDISYAYRQGRKQIKRITEFCRKYLVGFEEAYISQVAPSLGIRDSRRIEGVYQLTEDDILNNKKFEHSSAKSNYPFDVHGKEKDKNEITRRNEKDYYDIPIEALTPKNISNLMVVGKCLSATFKAQSSARIMPNCIAMGESAGKAFAARLKSR